MAPDGLGDDPQEPSLDVFDAVVERVQQLLAPGDRRLGKDLRAVPVWVALAQRMTGRQLPAPVEHLFPVGHVAGRRSLDEQPRIPRLTMAFRGDEALLDLLGHREEVGEHAVGAVEQILRQIVAGVHESGGQTAPNAVDDGSSLGGRAALEREQIDVENVIHGSSVARIFPQVERRFLGGDRNLGNTYSVSNLWCTHCPR